MAPVDRLETETVEAMLRREEDLRLCAETQAAFYAARREPGGVFRIVEELQRRVCEEFELPEEIGLTALRCAQHWIGEAKAKELSLYRRHNRCVDGLLTMGAPAPLENVPPLPSLGNGVSPTARFPGQPLELTLRLSETRFPLVLVAGSHS